MLIYDDLDFDKIRADFPILNNRNRSKPLIYFDSAASAQKPIQVIDAIKNFYTNDYANIHRGIYELSERSTRLYEDTRETVKNFINAPDKNDIIFVKGTTEGINLVAQSLGRSTWQAGDEVILSVGEHHSNIVPWYLLAQQIGIVLKVIPIFDDGSIDLLAYRQLFSERTKLVTVSHVSNAMGVINPIQEMISIAKEYSVLTLVDGAQAIPHMKVDVTELGSDFYVFSSHKLYGPTGVGVLYARSALQAQMPPYQGGGDMIETVDFAKVTFAHGPQKFEAGTPNIADVIGLNAAIKYLTDIGIDNLFRHEQELLDYAENLFATLPQVRIIGTAKPKIGVLSFVLENIHPHDVGTVLDHEGIAIRAGHHCTMPLMKRFNVPATVRASFGLYNTKKEIHALVEAIKLAIRIFS